MSIKLGSVTLNPSSQTANSKGGWSTIATPTVDLYGLTIVVIQSTSNGGRHIFDVAYGATPTLKVINFPGETGQLSHASYDLPVFIPANSAVKIRTQYQNANNSTIVWHVFGHTEQGGRQMFDTIECLNPDLTTTKATPILTGNTSAANTEGDWVEVIASLPYAANRFRVSALTDNITYAGQYLIDVTTGTPAPGDTAPFAICDNHVARRVSGNGVTMHHEMYYASVAAGTRIAARVQADTAIAGSRDIPVFVVAYYGTPASSGNTIIRGSGMQRLLKDGETVAERKTIQLSVITSANAHYNADGETPRIKIGAGAWGDASGTVVGTADGNSYTLTDAEAAAGAPGELILVYLPSTVNHLRSPIATYEVGPFDPSSSTIDAQVKGMDAGVVTAVQSGLATSSALAAVAGYIDTEVAAIKAKTDNLPAAPAAVSDVPSATTIRDAILSWELWSGFSLARAFRVITVLLRGKSSGQQSTAPSFENDDASIIVSATLDAQSNRTAVTDNASNTP